MPPQSSPDTLVLRYIAVYITQINFQIIIYFCLFCNFLRTLVLRVLVSRNLMVPCILIGINNIINNSFVDKLNAVASIKCVWNCDKKSEGAGSPPIYLRRGLSPPCTRHRCIVIFISTQTFWRFLTFLWKIYTDF